jgi:hypothetical protein
MMTEYLTLKLKADTWEPLQRFVNMFPKMGVKLENGVTLIGLSAKKPETELEAK